MLKNKTLGFLLLIGVIVNIILFLLLAGFSFYEIQNLSSNIRKLGKESIPSIQYIKEIKINLLNHRRALLALGNPYTSKEYLEYSLKLIETNINQMTENLKKYEEVARTEEEDRLFKNAVEIRKKHLEILLKYKKLGDLLFKTDDPKEKEKLQKEISEAAIEGEYREIFNQYSKAIDDLVDYNLQYYGNILVDESLKESSFSLLFILIVSTISIIFLVGSNLLIFNFIQKKLKNIILHLSSASQQIQIASNQVSSSSQSLSSHASELASSIEEITSSMEELKSIIDSNTQSVNESKILIQDTNGSALIAKTNSEDLEKAMNLIMENSKKINRINKVIEEIAFQTNILALNAAVEAARAGEAGRGFSVVAEQVKNLAQKSTESSKETNDLILEILESLEEGNKKVLLNKESIIKVSELTNKTMVLLDEIYLAFREQTKGVQQVTTSISQFNQSVQQVASSSEENASLGEELQSQILQVSEIIQQLQRWITKKEIALEKEQTQLKEDPKIPKITLQSEKQPVLTKNKKIEIIKPEEKIPLEDIELKDFKDF